MRVQEIAYNPSQWAVMRSFDVEELPASRGESLSSFERSCQRHWQAVFEMLDMCPHICCGCCFASSAELLLVEVWASISMPVAAVLEVGKLFQRYKGPSIESRWISAPVNISGKPTGRGSCTMTLRGPPTAHPFCNPPSIISMALLTTIHSTGCSSNE